MTCDESKWVFSFFILEVISIQVEVQIIFYMRKMNPDTKFFTKDKSHREVVGLSRTLSNHRTGRSMEEVARQRRRQALPLLFIHVCLSPSSLFFSLLSRAPPAPLSPNSFVNPITRWSINAAEWTVDWPPAKRTWWNTSSTTSRPGEPASSRPSPPVIPPSSSLSSLAVMRSLLTFGSFPVSFRCRFWGFPPAMRSW